MPRRKEIRPKVCVVAMSAQHFIETWSRRMENGVKVCVVAFVKRGRYDYETMQGHHVIAKTAPYVIVKPDLTHVIAKPAPYVIVKPDLTHVIVKPGPHTSLRSPSGLWQSL